MHKMSRLFFLFGFILLSTATLADNLKELLLYALQNNNIVISKTLIQKAMDKNVQATKNSYFPTFNIGASYTRLDNRSPYRPGDVYASYLAMKLNIYDGGQRKNIIKQQLKQVNSLRFTTLFYKDKLQLLIIKNYFKIKSLEATLYAFKEKGIDLLAEVKREKKLYSVGVVIYSDIDNIKAAFSNNKYQISNLQYQIQTVKQSLIIEVGRKINKLQNSTISPPKNIKVKISNEILSLKNSSLALQYQANSLMSIYRPKISLTDTYDLNGYGRYDAYHPAGQTNQNELFIKLDMRIFDAGVVKKQKAALLLQKMALQYQVIQDKKIQNMNIQLTLLSIKTINIQIISLHNALVWAKSAYKIVKQKYEVGDLDYIAYLNALNIKINTQAKYQGALNNLQVAYASYYFYANKNIQRYLK